MGEFVFSLCASTKIYIINPVLTAIMLRIRLS